MILYYLDKTKTHLGVGVGGLEAVLKVLSTVLKMKGNTLTR